MVDVRIFYRVHAGEELASEAVAEYGGPGGEDDDAVLRSVQ